ncbi:SMC-Scp complex subunit ScpB [Candidatus Woesearchaeota archaeon]|nr:SMC-Scp complex subunit ScpB [Candidatus Woesearchaeota archaeon]
MEPSELKNKVEAILFAAGKKASLEYISKLCRENKDEVLKALQELKSEYEAKNSSLLVSDEGDFWKITVRESYSPIVRKIVPEAELTRTMIETLAVIAWKAPVLQSDVIRIRTNKAYDHIAEIESAGFISREKHGRTQIIKLTQRFYDYFDVHSEAEVKSKFRNINEKLEKEQKNETDDIAKVPEVRQQDELPKQQQ